MSKSKKYDLSPYNDKIPTGFYVWNKPTYLISTIDKRVEKFSKFKKNFGFTPDEIWDLKSSIAVFILPRLKYFRKHHAGYPGCLKSNQKWNKILDKMIFSFESCFQENYENTLKKYLKKYHEDDPNGMRKALLEYNEDVRKGLRLFSEYFLALWS